MRKWIPLLAVCLGTFMLLLDVTIVNVALPSMALALDTSFTALQWVIDGYALALAALLLVAGSCADRFGRRRVYVAGLALFALASLACGLAPNPAVLVGARLAQGVGAAGMLAATSALLQTSYTGRDRGTAFGIWGAVQGAAAAAGPLLGGLLTEAGGWRAIFLVNLPIAVATIILTLRTVPETKAPAGRIDVLGSLAFTVTAASVVFALVSAGEHGWADETTLASFAIGVLALAAFVVLERRRTDPLLDLTLFRNPSFVVLMLTAVVLPAAAFGHLAYVSIWLQSLLGLEPIGAGLVVLTLSVAAFLVSASIGRLVHHVSPRWPIGIGMALIGTGVLLMMVDADSGWSALLLGLVVPGLGVGLGTPVLVSAALATVPGKKAGTAGGTVNTFQQLGTALSIAVFGTLFATRIASVVAADPGVVDPARTAEGLSSGAAQAVFAAVPAEARDNVRTLAHTAFADGLNQIFLVAGSAALLCAVLVLTLVRAATATPAVQQHPQSATPAGAVGK